MNFKPLDIVLVGNKGFIPSVIRFVTKFEYSHAGIVVEHLGELYVCEAIAKGFVPTLTIHHWLAKKRADKAKVSVLRAKECVDKQEHYGRLNGLVGNGYEFLNLGVYQLIKALTGVYIGTKNPKRLICSEAVAYIYEEYFDKPYETTPKEIYENKNFREIWSSY